jgi:hypothetical protein
MSRAFKNPSSLFIGAVAHFGMAADQLMLGLKRCILNEGGVQDATGSRPQVAGQ